jgi:hypothetical protein
MTYIEPISTDDEEWFEQGFYAPRCEQCGRFIAYEHAEHWGFCPRCLDMKTPDWRTTPPYEGLHCIICGAETGNTDMCVACSLKALRFDQSRHESPDEERYWNSRPEPDYDRYGERWGEY